jgi:hypothetical protein
MLTQLLLARDPFEAAPHYSSRSSWVTEAVTHTADPARLEASLTV